MYKKIDKIFKLLVGISFSILVSYEIRGIRDALKRIILFMEKENMLLWFTYSDTLTIIGVLRKTSLLCIFFYVAFILISRIIKIGLDKYNLKNSNTDNSFEDSLLKYLNDKNDKKTYLVTGDWGSGKTYIVSHFFYKFFKYSNRKIYRISCFGLESREQVLKEIQNQIELNDTSIINLIQYIPLFGQPVYTFLKDSFTLNNIKQNSIFIFDDFERITTLGLNGSQYGNATYYKKNPFLSQRINNRELEDEFKNIEQGIQKIQIKVEEQSITETFQKYNVVTGLINELVDSYNLKVLVICNIDILGHNYLDLIFRGKLDCINYVKSIDFQTVNSIFTEVLNNHIFNNEKNKEVIGNFFNMISEDFEEVTKIYGRTNLRYVKTTIQAFIETINLYFTNNIDCSHDYLTSLFYSIFVSKSLYDNNDIEQLSYFEVGGNLCFYLDLYSHPRNNRLITALRHSKFNSRIKWTGLAVSAYWVMNFRAPKDLENQLVSYSSYLFSEEEYALLRQPNFNFAHSYLIQHILYILLRTRSNDGNRDLEKALSKKIVAYFKLIDIDTILFESAILSSFDIVNTILDRIYSITNGTIYQVVFGDIYDKLYEKHSINTVPNYSHIHADYNRHVKTIHTLENE